MLIKQLSLFVENKPGSLFPICKVLKDNDISIRTLSLADTAEYGILRIIVNKPDKAKEILNELGIIVKITEVLTVAMDDTPGGLSKILEIFAKNDINVDYMYAFVGTVTNKALMVVKVSDSDLAVSALSNAGIATTDAKDIYRL